MVHTVTMLKPYQCEYDRVRTLTVHHTNKRRTRQCKYDRVRTQRYTIQTRRQCKYDRVRTQRYTIQTMVHVTKSPINVSTTACEH